MTLGTLVRGGQGQQGPLLALLVSGVFLFFKNLMHLPLLSLESVYH